jgi:SAM-dependent methyltransferase
MIITSPYIGFTRDILRGSSVYRALFNERVARYCATLRGRILDVAGDAHADYQRYLRHDGSNVQVLNIKGDSVDIEADFNKPLPLPDGAVDCALLFNAIYIAEDQAKLMKELGRVVKPDGQIFLTSPYISNEMRGPHDYLRLTSEGIERLAKDSGLRIELIEPFGERFTSAAYLLNPFWLFSPIRLIIYSIARGLDLLVPSRIRLLHPTPLGYFCIFTRV